MNARVPTLPTPTTLRAASTTWKRSSSLRRSSSRVVQVGAELLADHLVNLVGGQAVGGGPVAERDDDRRLADDPVGPVNQLTELGQRLHAVAGVCLRGCLRIRAFDAAFGSLASVSRLVLIRTPLSLTRGSGVRPGARMRIAAISSSSSRWAYQMSIVPICANSAIASR